MQRTSKKDREAWRDEIKDALPFLFLSPPQLFTYPVLREAAHVRLDHHFSLARRKTVGEVGEEVNDKEG